MHVTSSIDTAVVQILVFLRFDELLRSINLLDVDNFAVEAGLLSVNNLLVEWRGLQDKRRRVKNDSMYLIVKLSYLQIFYVSIILKDRMCI